MMFTSTNDSEKGKDDTSEIDHKYGSYPSNSENKLAQKLISSLIPILSNCIDMMTKMHQALVTLDSKTSRRPRTGKVDAVEDRGYLKRTTSVRKHSKHAKPNGTSSEKRHIKPPRSFSNNMDMVQRVDMDGRLGMSHPFADGQDEERHIGDGGQKLELLDYCYGAVDEGVVTNPVSYSRYMPMPHSSYFKESPTLSWVLIRSGEECFPLDQHGGFYGAFNAMCKRANNAYADKTADERVPVGQLSEDANIMMINAAILLKMCNTPQENQQLTWNIEECSWEVSTGEDDDRTLFPVRLWGDVLRCLLVAQFFRAISKMQEQGQEQWMEGS